MVIDYPNPASRTEANVPINRCLHFGRAARTRGVSREPPPGGRTAPRAAEGAGVPQTPSSSAELAKKHAKQGDKITAALKVDKDHADQIKDLDASSLKRLADWIASQ